MAEVGAVAQDEAEQASQAHFGVRRGGPARHHLLPLDAAFSDDLDMDAAAAIGSDAADTGISHTSSSSPRHVRFPPGYANDEGSGSSSALHSLTSASTLSTLESNLSPQEVAAKRGLLRDSILGGEWKDDHATGVDSESPEEMQKNDPLGTQIWKLYHKTRGQLPNSERLENLTWRMMSMNLRRKEMERQGYRRPLQTALSLYSANATPHSLTMRPGALNPPSGIAQLRQSTQQTQAGKGLEESMDLDEFIVPSSIGTPAGVSPAPSSTAGESESLTSVTTLSAIPIKQQQRLQSNDVSLARASAPSVPPLQASRTNQEFNYVQRHVRKTSIDERRVCRAWCQCAWLSVDTA